MTLDTLRQDLALGWRSLRTSPGYAVLVVVTLGLGIAATTTIVSVMNPYLIKELPYEAPDRLVQLGYVDPVSGWDGVRFSLQQTRDLEERSRSIEALATYYYTSKNLTGEGEAEGVVAGVLSGDLLELLGAEASHGRVFVSEDAGPGGEDIVLLSDGLWRRRFGADPAVVGRTVQLDGVAHTVIGTMGPSFNFPFGGVRIWVPLRSDAAREDRDETRHIPVVRLRSGWSLESARNELEAVHEELARAYPDADGRFSGVTVKPLGEALNFGYDIMKVSFLVLLGAVVFVLLIACVNVASLTLVRVSTRSRDVAVRSALGAARGRIVAQLLTESFLLAAAAGVLGVALAHLAVGAVAPMIPDDLYRVGEVEVDAAVLLFAIALTLATPLVFGLVPALGASRANLSSVLAASGRGGGAGRGATWARRTLVVVEVAMAIVLVTGTGLMLRSFMALQDVDLGFDEANVLTAELTLPPSSYESPEARRLYFERAVEEMTALPGVRAAGVVLPLPMNHETWGMQFQPPGMTTSDRATWPLAQSFYVSPGYFETMAIPVLSGRAFDASDGADAPPRILVSAAMAERYWPDGSPVGEILPIVDEGETVMATVAGIVASVKHEGFEDDLAAQIYRPASQTAARRRFLVVAVEGEPTSAVPTLREALVGLDPDVPAVYRPLGDIVAESALQWSISSIFLGAFGAVALALAALGIYGVVSQSVASRRREIATRIALGATSDDIHRSVLGDGLKLTGIGLAVGLLLAVGVARLVASVLFGVGPFDPLTLTGVVAVFGVVATVASFFPALRASHIQPWRVLRSE